MLAVVKNGALIGEKISGQASLEHNTPVLRTSLFDFSVLEERVTALAALALVEDGVLSLDRPVSTYLGAKVKEHSARTMRAALQQVAGDQWRPSHDTTRLAQEVIAKISGRSFAAFAQERLIEPARMARARINDPLEPIIARVETYQNDNGLWRRFPQTPAPPDGMLLSVEAAPGWRRMMAGDPDRPALEDTVGLATLKDGRALPFTCGAFVDRIGPWQLRWRKSGAERGAAIWLEAGELCVLCAMNATPDQGFAARLALEAVAAFSETPGPLDLSAVADSRTDLTAAAAAQIMGQGARGADDIAMDVAPYPVVNLDLVEDRQTSQGQARWYRLSGANGERSLARVLFDRAGKIYWVQII